MNENRFQPVHQPNPMVTIKEATEKRSKKAGQNNEKTWKQVEEENSKGRGKNGGQGVIQALKGT